MFFKKKTSWYRKAIAAQIICFIFFRIARRFCKIAVAMNSAKVTRKKKRTK